jgi:hypothetical protein
MTKNKPDLQTTPTNQTIFESDRVLLLGQVTKKKEKVRHSNFLKFLSARHTNGTFGFARYTGQPFAKPNEPLFHVIFN